MTDTQPLPERSQIVQEHLDAAGITGRVRELPGSTRTAADAAAALGCEIGAIASSLLFVVDDEPVLVMTSGRHRVDTELLAEQLGAASVTMASAKLVRETTGQPIGGVSPVGHPAPIRTVVDAALDDYDTIWAAGGTPHAVFPLTFADLVAVTSATPLRVAHD
ncbi:YbaK/EbsC family protein [Herbiconiux sp. KACC 21604]|uniref:YbaK/EbsC family protein n=1 Tax=unclassified Herbiconiux TaxID=2618217 RepID=UPI00149290D1|nr:YbaK/EbsC family protein [Herbiconiux sp. SALV-R1]QJU53083.1 YbaK/EbsC family protein [Herbiconiux sp. SALV-R1]WPO88017.1 YbaK/EbsC family protein [Herbiconiux sp. KACC 21604]